MKRTSESGNIFFALFGAVALVGILGAGVMTFMKGPLATSVRVTRQNTAETQMMIGAQVAVMASANTASSGDCDSDGYVEPLEWRDAGALAAPAGGGLIPMSIGISKKDPWGTEYGYCAWDHGTSSACDDETGAGDNPAERLGGAATGGAYPVVALISAGQDKVFTTTCRDFAAADVDSDGALTSAVDLPLVSKAAETDDDIIFTYTYDEATGASGGLWSIKSGDPDTAVINKKIETSGTASFQGGVLLPDSSLITCDPTTAGVMARNASGGIDICDGAGSWDEISGNGTSSFTSDISVVCSAATEGQVRYNSGTGLPEFCDGVAWRPFNVNVPNVNLVLTPNPASAMNVDGLNNLDPALCTGGWICGAAQIFTLRNEGSLTSATIAVSLSNTTNFVKTADTCNGTTLAAGISCTITIKPKANGNVSYTGNLNISADNNPFAPLQGTGSNFACSAGQQGYGGIVASCAPGGATYKLIVTPGGCDNSIPATCSGGTDYLQMSAASSWGWYPHWDDYNGAQLTVDQMSYVAVPTSGLSTPAAGYCAAMVYNGYDDWYLPADFEMRDYIYPSRSLIGGFRSDWYWSSTVNTSSADRHRAFHMTNSVTDYPYWYNFYVRCARREGQALPSPRVDTTPMSISFARSTTTTPGQRMTSGNQTIRGVNQNISVSVSGSGNPSLIIDGVDVGANGTATFGTTVAVTADAPAGTGQENIVVVTAGVSTFQWPVATIASQTIRTFVSSVDYTANLGGIAGADAKCTSLAENAGIGGTWQSILGVYGTSAKSRFPWNFTSLVNMNPVPQTVATSLSDFWDGTLAAPISYTEYGVYKNSNVWTGTDEYGNPYSNDGSYACSGWTSSGSENAYYGMSTATNDYWAQRATYEDGCSLSRPIYCVEVDPTAVDDAPSDISFMDQNLYSNGATIESDTVTITGAAPATPMTVTLGGTGTGKGFRINGGGIVTSGTVQDGDTISLVVDFPAVAEMATVTVQIGTGSTTTWTVRHLSTIASCKAILDNGGSTGDGIYSIDPDGTGGLAAFNVYCDMTTDGGGWTVVENYVHAGSQGCSAPSVRASNLPIPDMAATLGTNEAGSATKWGHGSPALLDKIPFGEMRFYCATSAHGRVIHFKTSLPGMISYAKTGVGTANGISSSYTALAGQSANIPGAVGNDNWGNAGDYALTGWTMRSTGTDSHWIAYGRGDSASHYYLCDEGGSSGCGRDTIHRIWVR